jgi:predicted kinase
LSKVLFKVLGSGFIGLDHAIVGDFRSCYGSREVVHRSGNRNLVERRASCGMVEKQKGEDCMTTALQLPRLFIFAGLPGVGKSTLARMLAEELGAVYLRIDTIEQAMRDQQLAVNGPEGYVVAYKIAGDNLRLGISVVADSVNPLRITRAAWREVATGAGVRFVEIEVICSDAAEHRARAELRPCDVPGLVLPTWDDVQKRERDPWDTTPVVIDTAGVSAAESFAGLLRLLENVT